MGLTLFGSSALLTTMTGAKEIEEILKKKRGTEGKVIRQW